MRKLGSLRKPEVSVGIVSGCDVAGKLEEHVIYFLPCSYANDVIYLLS